MKTGKRTYAYSCIHHFFDAFHCSQAIALLESIIYAACSPRVWHKEIPANLLYYIEKLRTLCRAMYALQNNAARAGAIVAAPEDGLPAMPAGSHSLPCSLTKKQYYNPWKALHKFCRHKTEGEWKEFFRQLETYALSREALDEVYTAYEIMKCRQRLLQAIEACHLIEQRTGRAKYIQENKE